MSRKQALTGWRLFLALAAVAVSPCAVAAEGPCPKSAKVYKVTDLEKLRLAVTKAALVADETAMKKLVSCDFLIGKPETDSGGFRRGRKVLHEISGILRGVKFKPKGDDFGTQVNFESEDPKAGVGLIFRKDDQSGWYWAGLTVADPITVAKLLKGAYAMGSAKED